MDGKRGIRERFSVFLWLKTRLQGKKPGILLAKNSLFVNMFFIFDRDAEIVISWLSSFVKLLKTQTCRKSETLPPEILTSSFLFESQISVHWFSEFGVAVSIKTFSNIGNFGMLIWSKTLIFDKWIESTSKIFCSVLFDLFSSLWESLENNRKNCRARVTVG